MAMASPCSDRKKQHKHRPFNVSMASIPFSWEEQPGVPKTAETRSNRSTSPTTGLPLPPPLKPKPNQYLAWDPFTAALIKCSDPGTTSLMSPARMPAAGRRRRTSLGGIRWLWLFSMSSSCKTTDVVVDSVVIPCPRCGRCYSTAPHVPLARN